MRTQNNLKVFTRTKHNTRKNAFFSFVICMLSLSLYAQNANDFFDRGNSKAKLGDYRGAIADFNTAIEINPKFAEAYFNRGISKDVLGDKNGACLDWSKAAELGIDCYDLIREDCK